MIKFAAYFLDEYRKSFEEDMKATITWDFIVQVLGVGTSDGRLGIWLLIAGSFLMLLGAGSFFASLF